MDFYLCGGELTWAQCLLHGTLISSSIHKLLPSLRTVWAYLYSCRDVKTGACEVIFPGYLYY